MENIPKTTAPWKNTADFQCMTAKFFSFLSSANQCCNILIESLENHRTVKRNAILDHWDEPQFQGTIDV